MSVLAIVLIVVGALLLVLFLGGLVAAGRRRRAGAARLQADLAAADAALAQARAQDKGWERETIEAAAREAFAARHPGVEPKHVHLVQVVDRPGTDADLAVFRVISGHGHEETITLGRRDGAWISADAL
jgi:hypothetical protein